MNIYPKEVWPRMALSILFEATKDPEKAVGAIDTGLLDHPDWEEGYIRKAELLARMPNRGKDSRAALEEGLRKIPASVSIRTVYGAAQLGIGETDGALKTVQPLVDYFLANYGTAPDTIQKLRPYMQGARVSALALYQLSKPTDALNVGLKLWDIDPMDLANANNMAWILAVEEKQYPKAWEIVSRCIRMVPNNPQVLDTAGWVAFLMGKSDEAIENLQSSIKYGPNLPDAHYHLGRVYESLTRTAEAVEQYGLALKQGLAGTEKTDAEKRVKALGSSAK
jgi:tetratricopeptide (TPR) repeat protein